MAAGYSTAFLMRNARTPARVTPHLVILHHLRTPASQSEESLHSREFPHSSRRVPGGALWVSRDGGSLCTLGVVRPSLGSGNGERRDQECAHSSYRRMISGSSRKGLSRKSSRRAL